MLSLSSLDASAARADVRSQRLPPSLSCSRALPRVSSSTGRNLSQFPGPHPPFSHTRSSSRGFLFLPAAAAATCIHGSFQQQHQNHRFRLQQRRFPSGLLFWSRNVRVSEKGEAVQIYDGRRSLSEGQSDPHLIKSAPTSKLALEEMSKGEIRYLRDSDDEPPDSDEDPDDDLDI